MKKLLNLTLIAIACLAVACHKDATLTRLAPVAFTSPVTASTNNVTLTEANSAATAVTFNWKSVVYPVKGQVTYTLQIDLASDTTGATGWAHDTTFLVGNDLLTTSMTGAALNSLAVNKFKVPAGDSVNLAFRIEAYQDRSAFSKPVTVHVQTYAVAFVPPPPPASMGFPVLYIPGFYQGWSPPTAGTVAAEQPGIYEGYVYMPVSSDPSAYHFKFTSAPDWNHTNYGDAGGGKLTTDGTAGDLVLPGPGFYELVCNTTTLTWSYTPITWGMIGTSIPGNNYASSVEMTYDPVLKVWKLTTQLVKDGAFKFRANDAWNIDFGVNPAGRLGYADNPAYPYNPAYTDITVPADGDYTVYLNLNDPNAYYYYLQKL